MEFKKYRHLLFSYLLFVLILLLLIPLLHVLFIEGSNFHLKLRTVFLLQKINKIAAISGVLFIFLLIKKDFKYLKPKREYRFFLLSLLFFSLSFYTQSNFLDILNQGVGISVVNQKASIDMDYFRFLNLNVFNDIDNNAELVDLSSKEIKKVVYSEGASNDKELFLAVYSNNFSTSSLSLKLNNQEFFYNNIELKGKKGLLSIPISKNLIKNKNEIEISGENISVFAGNIYLNGNTFSRGKNSREWEIMQWWEALIYFKEDLPFYKTALFKLGFIFRILAIFSLFIFSFGLGFLKKISKQYKKELFFSTVFAYITYWIGYNVRIYWESLSFLVSYSVYFFLRLLFGNSAVLDFSNPNLPVVGVNGFIAGIAEPCSGIDSIAFFCVAFILLTLFFWKEIDFKRHIIAFFLGLLGAFVINIFRVILIFLIGIYISQEFAINIFHTNAAMIIFSIYFLFFWFFITKKPSVNKRNRNNSK